MAVQILATKLYIPFLQPNVIARPRLIKRLNKGLHRKLTLVSAPAGFGKTTLISEWVTNSNRPTAWLSLDDRDKDIHHFLVYLIAACQTINKNLGDGTLELLQNPHPWQTESILTGFLNEIAATPEPFILVLDDYHLLNNQMVNFLICVRR